MLHSVINSVLSLASIIEATFTDSAVTESLPDWWVCFFVCKVCIFLVYATRRFALCGFYVGPRSQSPLCGGRVWVCTVISGAAVYYAFPWKTRICQGWSDSRSFLTSNHSPFPSRHSVTPKKRDQIKREVRPLYACQSFLSILDGQTQVVYAIEIT